MFKTNPDGMRMEPTPERVLSVCRLIAQKSITHEELRQAMTLGQNGEKEIDQINKSLAVALEELNIVRTKDNLIELAVDPLVIKSPVNFRRYIGNTTLLKKDTTFHLFTKWVIAQNEKIFALKTWETMAKICGSQVSELSNMSENAALGWRYCASFLCFGYLSGTMIIPNMKIRIEDILATTFAEKFNYDEAIRATDFITWISTRAPEVDLSGKLPLAFSAGLRTLHELGLIKLETWRDSNRVFLYPVDGDPINDFSHITVRKEVAK